MARSKKQNKSSETIPEEAQALELLGKDFKTTILNIFRELKKNKDKKLKEIKEKNINKRKMSTEI